MTHNFLNLWDLYILSIIALTFSILVKNATAFDLRSESSWSPSLTPSTLVGRTSVAASNDGHFVITSDKERTALVTGASRGIGKSVAEKLAQGGVSKIICVAKSKESCDEVADQLKSYGCDAIGYGVDVSDGQSVKELCETILNQHGTIDILVNNAGITKDDLLMRLSHQNWNDVINTNLNSAFYFTSGLIRPMIRKKFGRIINMASVVGITGNVGQSNYAAAKAGMIGLTKSTAKEVASKGVTANAVAPGFIRSAMTDKMTEAAKSIALRNIPAGILGTPDDVSHLVAFLASDHAGYINGKVIPVDGAMT